MEKIIEDGDYIPRIDGTIFIKIGLTTLLIITSLICVYLYSMG